MGKFMYCMILLLSRDITTSALVPSKRAESTQTKYSRRGLIEKACKMIGSAVTSNLVFSNPSEAAETIGKDPDCNDAGCLGVWDGLLADCPHGKLALKSGAGCVSSQDDTPGIFAEPWDYSEASNSLDPDAQMRLLVVLQ
mmetsp:Transcript_34575/g.63857  ORF Transcript_34575/g.63857 Transcript_34575/m.63857 type:complete len:140 (-) Transcript_34575:241-660(-)